MNSQKTENCTYSLKSLFKETIMHDVVEFAILGKSNSIF